MKRFLLAALLCVPVGLAQNKKIVVTSQFLPLIPALQSASPNVTLVAASTPAEVLKQVTDADAIFGAMNPAVLKAGTKLKWVQIFSAGAETYLFPDFVNSDIVLTNCKIVQGPNIADHALALLLSLTRHLHETIPKRPTEEWLRGEIHP